MDVGRSENMKLLRYPPPKSSSSGGGLGRYTPNSITLSIICFISDTSYLGEAGSYFMSRPRSWTRLFTSSFDAMSSFACSLGMYIFFC